MRPLDRLLQRWRIARARPYIPPGARVLDVGCADGALFRQLHARIGEGVGIDPALARSADRGKYRLLAGQFSADLPDRRPFDVITMLAVLEHVPPDSHPDLARACEGLLRDGGCLVVTVPSPAVDGILRLLRAVRLVEGMSLEQHYGFDPGTTPSIFGSAGLALVDARTFQFGFNHLFVFQKNAEAVSRR